MSVYHTIANTPGHTVKMVNHFVAAYGLDGTLTAIFNVKSGTVQVFANGNDLDAGFDSWNPGSRLLGFRTVKVTRGNDARVFFPRTLADA